MTCKLILGALHKLTGYLLPQYIHYYTGATLFFPHEPGTKTMLSLRSPIVILILLVTALGLLLCSLILRIIHLRKKQSVTSDERYSTWLLLCLLAVAILSISAFGLYALFFVIH